MPLRLELGSNDLKSLSVLAVRRVDGSRASIPIAKLPEIIPNVLEAIQAQMLASARHERDANIAIAYVFSLYFFVLITQNKKGCTPIRISNQLSVLV